MSIKIVEECQSDFPLHQTKQLIQSTLNKAGRKGIPRLSVAIVSEKKIRSLNKEYRGKNQAAAVLSFSFQSQSNKPFILPKKESHFLGEIFLSPRDISRRAKKFGLSYPEQFSRLLVHGALHLLGFSHKTNQAAKKMEKLEEKILRI